MSDVTALTGTRQTETPVVALTLSPGKHVHQQTVCRGMRLTQQQLHTLGNSHRRGTAAVAAALFMAAADGCTPLFKNLN